MLISRDYKTLALRVEELDTEIELLTREWRSTGDSSTLNQIHRTTQHKSIVLVEHSLAEVQDTLIELYNIATSKLTKSQIREITRNELQEKSIKKMINNMKKELQNEKV